MSDHFGKIQIDTINNVRGDAELSEAFKELDNTSVRFVHYPDCQQLCIWLPRYGREYGEIRLVKDNTHEIVQYWQATDLLNGSIQLLWDTLSIPPGDYRMEIDWKDGWQHQVVFTKFEAEILKPVIVAPPAKTYVVQEDRQESKPVYSRYKNGAGEPIIDEDLVLRAKLLKDLAGKFGRHLEYDGNLRGGNVIYVEGDLRISFSHEMGGGNCMVYIDIPEDKYWEARTHTKLSRRKDILDFVAREVQRQQASNCNFEIKADSIVFTFK